MPRYIDADLIEYEPMCRAMGNGMYEDCEIAHKDQIDDIPTADVVEVVRCKDCKNRVDSQLTDCKEPNFCMRLACYANENDFCSYGERAEQ